MDSVDCFPFDLLQRSSNVDKLTASVILDELTDLIGGRLVESLRTFTRFKNGVADIEDGAGSRSDGFRQEIVSVGKFSDLSWL